MKNGPEEEKPNYDLITPKCGFNEIELNPKLRDAIFEVMEDRDYEDALVEEDLVPRKMVLLHGPPGCGKTSIAHAIAKETKLPLYLMSGANAVSAFVGESEKNIEEVFRFANGLDCVMLIDEFDSFAMARGGTVHVNRLVNTILVNMETRPPKGIMIACTNMMGALDPAVLRRFDLILEVPQLSRQQMVVAVEKVLRDRHGICPHSCVDEGKTPSGAVRVAKNKLRSAVIAANRGKPKKQRQKQLPAPAVQEPRQITATEAMERMSAQWGNARTQQQYIDRLNNLYVSPGNIWGPR